MGRGWWFIYQLLAKLKIDIWESNITFSLCFQLGPFRRVNDGFELMIAPKVLSLDTF